LTDEFESTRYLSFVSSRVQCPIDPTGPVRYLRKKPVAEMNLLFQFTSWMVFILGTDLNHGWLDGVVGMRGA
jgi:hypothetical protein